MTTSSTGAGTPRAGVELIQQWAGTLPADHLRIALKAVEPELRREHEWRVTCANLAAEEAQAKRTHMLYLTGLCAGFVVCMTMLIGAVVVGTHGQTWLAAFLSGPSVIALTTLFVLRRGDPTAIRAATRQPPPDPAPPIA